MQTKRTLSQFLLPACLMLGSIMLTACGQKGPLTLPQAAPEKQAQPSKSEAPPTASEEQIRGPL
jgi:predicted small lipoprotein YifL